MTATKTFRPADLLKSSPKLFDRELAERVWMEARMTGDTVTAELCAKAIYDKDAAAGAELGRLIQQRIDEGRPFYGVPEDDGY